jgi:calcineurin-like phosphoesterase family protein
MKTNNKGESGVGGKIFFTADTHFGHGNILKYCDRPFKSVYEHDKQIIKNWNEVVGEKDTVYHLGDFAFTKQARIVEILEQLNGIIHLIRGNHDRKIKGHLETKFVSIKNYCEISIEDEEMDHKQMIVMSHYPFESWNKKHWRSFCLHGHTHGTSPSMLSRLDVGVDSHNYYPISYEEVKTIITKDALQRARINSYK